MTDNRTTEPINDRVNRLLHEAGADFTVRSLMRTGSMEPYDKFTVFDADKMPAAQIEASGHNDETVLLTLRCTPEQAIAATLGSERGTCHAEIVSRYERRMGKLENIAKEMARALMNDCGDDCFDSGHVCMYFNKSTGDCRLVEKVRELGLEVELW